jgi:CRISPR-associated protein Csd1
MAGLSTNGSRLVLRSWLTEGLSEVKGNLRRWFLEIEMQPLTVGVLPTWSSIWQVLYALDPDGKPLASQKVALLRRVLGGREKEPLGLKILSTVLSRIRVDRTKRLNAAALGLVRVCINDRIHMTQSGVLCMNASLDETNKDPAYLCGRLLALQGYLQYTIISAVGKSQLNVRVGDRYYGLASTSPQLAFPKIAELSRRHLQKLQRVKHGLAWAIEADIVAVQREMEEASGSGYPALLGLEGQGRFALGYYHQRVIQFQAKKVDNNVPDTVTNERQEKP